MLSIYLLGPLRIVSDGVSIKFSARPKTVPLLAYLLLERRQPVERQALSFALWPDDSEVKARVNLRRHLYELRHALPPAPAALPWLLHEADSIQWNPAAPYRLDVAEFERLSASAQTLAEAAALYAGDLLANVYDDWLFYERERLRNLYFAGLSQLIADGRRRRDYPAAIAHAQQLLNHDPLREDTLRQLVGLSYEAGDRSGALQTYKRFARRLRDELGMEPMPETVALYEAIVRNTRLPEGDNEPLRQADQREAGAARRPDFHVPFVGRENELEQLRGWWSHAAHGSGGVVLVSGEAGIGKSRLIGELAGQAEREGARVLLGGTTFIESIAYQPVIDALRSAVPLLAALDIEPLWLSALATLLPELHARRSRTAGPAWPPLPVLDPERERMRFFEAIARCLERLANPRPVLLILEDLHWADQATMALLEFLARRVPQHALLILVTYREEETARAHPLRDLRRRLQREQRISHLPLAELPAQAIEALVAQLPTLAAQGEGLVDTLYRESEGHPFYLVELIRERLESGKPGPSAGSRQVQAMIQGRVAQLSADARALAEVAAVVGPAFDVELVREVSGWNERQVLDGIGELLDRHLVSEARGHSGSDYVFSHHLIHAVIYDGMSPDERKRRHRRVAQLLEEIYPQRLAELASELAAHWDRGGEPEPATRYYLQAARYALAVYADETALAHLSRALALTADERMRSSLLALSESIHARQGERAAQQADLEQLAALAQALNDDDLLCDVLQRQILLQRALGERQAEAELIARLRARAAASGQARWQAEALQAEAILQLALSQYAEARVTLQKVLALRQALTDAAGQAACYAWLAEAASLQGRFGEAQAMLKRAAALAGPEANQSLLVQTLRSAAIAATVQIQSEAALALGTQMLELCRMIGDRVGEADAHARLAAAAARLFQVAEARQHYEQAATLYGTLGDQKGRAAVLLNSAMLLANLGQYADAIAQNQQAELLFKTLGDMRGQTLSDINASFYFLQTGDHAAAQAAGARSVELARAMHSELYEAYALSNLATAERELGQLAQAIAHMEAATTLRRKFGQAVELATDLTDLTIAYVRAGELASARATSAELMAIFAADPEHMTYPQYILWAAAQTSRASGEFARAQELLTQAHVALQAKAATIPDPASRATFLQMPTNGELLTAYERGDWPRAKKVPRPRRTPPRKASTK